MDKQTYERLVLPIDGGPSFASKAKYAYSFPEETGLSYDDAYVRVEALGWDAMGKNAAAIYRTFVDAGVPAEYVRRVRPSLNLYTVNDAVMFIAFYKAGVSASYSRAMWSWPPTTVLRFHGEKVDPGYGVLPSGEVERLAPADVLHLHRAGAPPEYAVPLLRKGLRGQVVAEMWSSGIPLEYALTLP